MQADQGSTRSSRDGVGYLLDRAPCGFLTFRDDGRIEQVNATLLAMVGRESTDVVGQHIEMILSVGTRIFYQTHWFPLLRLHGRAEEIFLLLRAGDGSELGVLANAARREAGGATLYDCVFMRVRERQKYEDELLRARRVADEARAIAEQQRATLQEANAQLSAQAVELEQQQVQLQEQALELEVASEELHAINEDLRAQAEEMERLKDAAEEANQAKSTFLAVMSHELRTPLNAIAGYTELIQMGLHGPVTDAQRDSLERIRSSQRHLLRLINDVLNLARVESGRLEYDVSDFELADVVTDVLPMLEPQLAAQNLAFETAVPAGLVARADREKVQQILLNLMSNAIKFTPPGGRVSIDGRAAPSGDGVELSVIDTGRGIPPEKQPNIFEPFVQVDMGRTGRKEGTGLGLAISRDLARGMDGDLTLESVPGRGSEFTLVLPRAATA